MQFKKLARQSRQSVLLGKLLLGLLILPVSLPIMPAKTLAQTQQVVGAESVVFKAALRFTLYWEGGYSNHPADAGGKTYRGIIQSEYDNYRVNRGLPQQDVRQMADIELWEIYYSYWQAANAETMSPLLAITMFDTAVNFGRGGAVRFLQQALGVPVTGSFDATTWDALDNQNQSDVAKRLIEDRIKYRYQRVMESPSQRVFLQGWLNRDYALWSYLNWFIQSTQAAAQ